MIVPARLNGGSRIVIHRRHRSAALRHVRSIPLRAPAEIETAAVATIALAATGCAGAESGKECSQ